jgi:signal transduction histidine kinase
MLADSNRLLTTVEQVLSASKSGDTRKRYEVEELELAKIVEDSAGIVRTRYHLDPAAIRVGEIPSDVKVAGDADELQTAFVNLLDNAVKYSGDDVRITVKARASSIRNKIDIFIRDSGIGIPAPELKRFFKRFYRVQQTGGKKVKGTGLGLFIVNSIIKKHGGSIRADSKGEGRGATFIVQLPRA